MVEDRGEVNPIVQDLRNHRPFRGGDVKDARKRGGLPGRDPPTTAQVEATVELLELLADETRLQILWALSAGEFDVTSLVVMTGSTKTATSQHLARLRDANVVTVRRDGRRKIYRLASGHLRKLIREAFYQADHLLQDLPPHG